MVFDTPKSGFVIMTNSGNGEGIFKYLLEAVLRDTYTPIEWEGYTPYDQLPPRTPRPQHKAVQVAPAVLDRYVGSYGESPKLVLTIRREGDHLSIQENDEPKQELLPESDTEFFSTVADDVYQFGIGWTGSRNTDGAAHGRQGHTHQQNRLTEMTPASIAVVNRRLQLLRTQS